MAAVVEHLQQEGYPVQEVISPISGPHGMRISTSMGSTTSILKRPAGAKASTASAAGTTGYYTLHGLS